MSPRVSIPMAPARDPSGIPTRSSTLHLSSVVERMLVRHRSASTALDALTLLPMGEAAYRPVRTGPANPGTPLNIRVNDPSEDTIFGNRTTQSEPSLAVSGHTVVIAFNDSTPIGSFAGLAHSINLGQVFSDEGALTPADESGNPSLAVDPRGVFYCASTIANFHTQESWIGLSRSSDGGMTFPAPRRVSGVPEDPARTLLDMPWLAIDRSDSPFRGNLYLCWTRFDGFDWTSGQADHSRIQFVRSQDGGATWSVPVDLTEPGPAFGPQGAVAVVDPEGRVFVGWIARDREVIELRRSDDGGMAFMDPVMVAAVPPVGGTVNGSLRAADLLSLAVDPVQGTLYAAYAARPRGASADVFLVRSLDQGMHWSQPAHVNDDGTDTDQWLPSAAVTADGIVGVMFFDRRNDPADNLNIDVYLALSSDQGTSFLPNRRITTSSFPPPLAVDPRFEAQHLGDRIHLVAQGTRFCMAWGDNRDFVGRRNDPNIYFATAGTRDCYLRDDPTDEGVVPHQGLSWISPDIVPSQDSPVPGTETSVAVSVRNLGPFPARDVRVLLCWSEAATYVPTQAWHTDHISVGGRRTCQQLIPEIPAGGVATVPEPFLWTPPFPLWAPGQGHFCLCAQADGRDDLITFPSGGAEGIRRDNNLAVRSIHTLELGRPLRFLVSGNAERLWLADLILDGRALPAGWRVELTLPEGLLWYAKFEGLKVVRRHHEGAPGRKERRGAPLQTEATMLEVFERLNVTFEFEPGHVARILDMELPPGARHLAELTFHPGEGIREPARSALRIQQLVNHVPVGGLLYQLLPSER